MGLTAVKHKFTKVLVDCYQDTILIHCPYQDKRIIRTPCLLHDGDHIMTQTSKVLDYVATD